MGYVFTSGRFEMSYVAYSCVTGCGIILALKQRHRVISFAPVPSRIAVFSQHICLKVLPPEDNFMLRLATLPPLLDLVERHLVRNLILA